MTQPEETQLHPFAQRATRRQIWKPTSPQSATALRLQILADAQRHIHANLKRSR